MVAVVELTRKQIIEAVRQLKDDDRLRVLRELVGKVDPQDVRRAADQLRSKFRLPADRQRRLSALLQRANAGTLTATERAELDALCEEANQRTLDMARELVAAAGSSTSDSGVQRY